jgi:hypothetical protein
VSATAFVILCFAVFGVLYGGVVIITRRDARIREQFQLDTEPAFEVELEYPNLPQELVEAIRPSVDRVGVVRGLGEIRDAQGRKREVRAADPIPRTAEFRAPLDCYIIDCARCI